MYGFIITTAGETMLARAAAGERLKLTGVTVGRGAVASEAEAKALAGLLDPVAAATSTEPAVAGGQLSMLVEYRNDMAGGLAEGFDLKEFGIFAQAGDDAPALLYYAGLGDSPQPVQPISQGLDIHRFPVAVAVTGDVAVTLGYPAGAFATHEDLEAALGAPTQEKDEPADGDSLTLADSADGGKNKRLTWGSLKTALGALFAATGHTHAAGDLTGGTLSTARLPTVPVNKGGTGAATAAAARANLGACTLAEPVTVTADVAAWAGSGPWTQTVTVAGVTAQDEHIGVFPVDTADADARKLYEKAYGCLSCEAETVAGGVALTCRDGKPEISFQVRIKGVR